MGRYFKNELNMLVIFCKTQKGLDMFGIYFDLYLYIIIIYCNHL